jgi:NitT/TauT family transport system ATP-binding protein
VNNLPVKLSLRDVAKSFSSSQKDDLNVLAGVNLDIHEGEFVVLVGPSGCGKSTLLNLIAGFDKPDDGTIFLDQKPVTAPGNDRLFMFQEHTLFPWLNVLQNVMFGLKHKFPFKLKIQREVARSYLKMVHLEKFEDAFVHELSGGMKHRVALARALAPNPKILMIDEPFQALDPQTRIKLYGDIQEIFTRTKKTIIAVSHDPREAACLGDRVIVFSGRPAGIKTEIRIDLPRPRDFADHTVSEYANQIMKELEDVTVYENAN